MADVLPGRASVHEQDSVAAGTLAGKLRIEMCRTAEGNYELEESHAGKKNLAAGVHIVEMDIVAVHVGAGSHCVLVEPAETAAAGIVALAGLVEIVDTVVLAGLVEPAETAAAGIVALAGLVEIVDTVVLAGLVELADIGASVGLAVIAGNDVFDTVGSADTVAQGTLGVVADTAAQFEILAGADTAEWAEFAEIVGDAVPGIVDSVDTAGGAGTVGLVRVVEVVDTAEAAAGTADTVAATEWQPYLTAFT